MMLAPHEKADKVVLGGTHPLDGTSHFRRHSLAIEMAAASVTRKTLLELVAQQFFGRSDDLTPVVPTEAPLNP